MLSVFIGLRYTGARRRSQLVSFISGISIAGLIVSVALLVVVLSVMNGFDKQLRERILAVVPQASIYHRDGIEDWLALREQLLNADGVADVAPFVQLTGMARRGGEVAPLTLYGVEPEYERGVSAIESYLSAAELSQLQSSGEGSGKILVGAGLAEKLSVGIGDRLTLIIPDNSTDSRMPNIQGLEVAGIINTGTELDQALALTSLGTAKWLSGFPDRVSGLRLRVDDLFAAPNIVYSIIRDLPYGYYGMNWTRSHGNLYQAIHMSKKLVGLLLILIIGIAAFNVVSTLVMVVVDKQGDIAILRTLGASTQKIMGVFMVQGSMIGFIGTGVGLILGVIIAWWVPDLIAWLEKLLDFQFLKSDVYPISFVPSQILWQDLLAIAATALILSFFATLYPAWRASRVKPAEALRFE